MALTDINSEDRPVQQTFAAHLEKVLGWESIYAYNEETFARLVALATASMPSRGGRLRRASATTSLHYSICCSSRR